MSTLQPNSIFETAAEVRSAVSTMPRNETEAAPTRQLSAAAQIFTQQPYEPAYSPIVLAGTVRLIEAALVVAVGFGIYAAYVVPTYGFAWYYFVAIFGIAALAMMAFQIADIYQVQAFRGHEKQYMRLASAWSVVFLIAIGVSFFAKAGDQFSRAWLGAFYVIGLFTLIAFRRGLFLLVRRWTKEGRLDRRTVVVGCDNNGETLIRSLAAQRDSDVHVIGAFDDRSDDRSPPNCGGVPKLGTVDDLVEFARAHTRRSGDLLAADLGREPHPADAQEAVGAAGRYPAVRPHQQAALPAALLFLHRQRAGARRVRQADRRLGRGDEMAVRQNRRIAGADRRASGHGGRGHRHQARQPRTGAVSGKSATASTTS